jgi:hypothetical protein
MDETQNDIAAGATTGKGRRVWRWVMWTVLISVIVLVVIGEIVIRRAAPILKGRVIQTLSDRFDSRVELDDLDVSIMRGLEVSGKGLRIFPPDDVVAAGAKDPLIAVQAFQFHTGIVGLFVKPMHVGTVHAQGLSIHIPPREMRNPGAAAAQPVSGKHGKPPHQYKIKIVVDEIVFDDSELVIGTMKPNKDPKRFVLKHISIHDVGPNRPWPYDATLTNAIPKGDIHATGAFGPWNNESPGDSPITGEYTFDHVDLNTIKGIGGMLSSVGTFNGQLDKIQAQGTAKVPNFSLDTANHPVPLKTQFTVIVDGLTGDTYLQPVHAVLGSSAFTCTGAVVNVKGKGHIIDMDVNVPKGRIAECLQLAVKTQPPVMTGVMQTRTRLHIRYGKESVSQKMSLKGEFQLNAIEFTRPAVQSKVDMLSARAEGHPDYKDTGLDVAGQMNGDFAMDNGELKFSGLHYAIPGATVALQGVYSLDGKKFDFYGKVRTEAKLSQMVSTWWKSLLLKPVDPFFAKNGAGVEVPVKVTGTNGEPKFGLDFGRKDNQPNGQPAPPPSRQ